MKKLIILYASIVLVSSLLSQNVLGSDIPYAENRQELQRILNDVKSHIQDETSSAYPKVKKVGMRAQEKLINFDAENSTVEYEVIIQVNNAIMNNDRLLSGELTKTSKTIRISEKLFQQLQNRQAYCCTIS
ncbi:MAG: hypothetical protein Q8Q60_05435 [Candidatus Chromulinivorax sp.]|nr:hypothetical protein [Candidatus Chromulinivorax sp.]